MFNFDQASEWLKGVSFDNNNSVDTYESEEPLSPTAFLRQQTFLNSRDLHLSGQQYSNYRDSMFSVWVSTCHQTIPDQAILKTEENCMSIENQGSDKHQSQVNTDTTDQIVVQTPSKTLKTSESPKIEKGDDHQYICPTGQIEGKNCEQIENISKFNTKIHIHQEISTKEDCISTSSIELLPIENSRKKLYSSKVSSGMNTKILKSSIKLNLSTRSDIVIKSVLRAIRKYYLNMFNEVTQFQTLSKNLKALKFKDQIRTFANYCIEEYLPSSQLKEKKIDENSDSKQLLRQELEFVFGSIFYPKLMLLNDLIDDVQIRKVKMIHSTLYNYSQYNLEQLLKEYESLRLIIMHSYKAQTHIIQMSKCDSYDIKQVLRMFSKSCQSAQ